jgi:DNA-binding NarL/FixJ family response regulator
LRKAADIVVIGEANNGAEAIRLINQLRPDVLLLDIEMPGMTGVDVIRRLDEAGIDVNILVLSAYDDQEYILEMLGSGASGYLLKEETPEYILDAVRGVANGQRGWVSDRVARKLQQLQQTRRSETTLTFMEMDILRLMAADKNDEEISAALHIEPTSVDKIVRFLLKKLGVETRQQAVEVARTNSWID